MEVERSRSMWDVVVYELDSPIWGPKAFNLLLLISVIKDATITT